MQVKEYTVSGTKVRELTSAVSERVEPQVTHSGEEFAVFMLEKSDFWRTNSDMQATIILDQRSPDTCFVKVTVGGGATGMLDATWGAEKKKLEELTPEIEAVCDDLNLRIDAAK